MTADVVIIAAAVVIIINLFSSFCTPSPAWIGPGTSPLHGELGGVGSQVLATQTTPMLHHPGQPLPKEAPSLSQTRPWVRARAVRWHKGWVLSVPAVGAAAHGGPSGHNEAFEQLLQEAGSPWRPPGSHKPCLSVRPLGQAGSCRGGRARACPAAGHTISPASSGQGRLWA